MISQGVPPPMPSSIDEPRAGYLAGLDGLRAVAILVVMGSHVISEKLFPGQFGVTLFFFISGFIITRNLLVTELTIAELPYFYLRRLFRLTPAVIVYVIVAFWTLKALGGSLPVPDMAASLLYVANYHEFARNTLAGVFMSPLELTWSLAVEEHFYLVFPLLVIAAAGVARLVICCGVAIGLTLAWRFWRLFHGAGEWELYVHTDLRIDSILYGCLLSAVMAEAGRSARVRAVLAALSSRKALCAGLGLLGLTFVIRDPFFRSSVRYLMQGVALMPVFCFLFRPERKSTGLGKLLSTGIATRIGRLSYSLYLYHLLCLIVVLKVFPGSAFASALVFIGAFACAFASYMLVEQPGRRLGRRIIRRVKAARVSRAMTRVAS